MPQSVIDMAQTAFAAASGAQGGVQSIGEASSQAAQLLGLSPMETGQLERSAHTAAHTMMASVTKNALEGRDNGDDSAIGSSGSRGKGKGDSFLVAFAKAMGKSMDDKMNKMMTLSKDIDAQTKIANDSGGKRQAASCDWAVDCRIAGFRPRGWHD